MARDRAREHEHEGEGRAPDRMRGGAPAWRGEWHPFNRMLGEMESMFDRMQRELFGSPMFGRSSSIGGRGSMRDNQRMPEMDMQDTGNEIVMTAELPGVDPEHVSLEYHDGVLTLRGESHREESGLESRASFFRQITMPDDVDVDHAQASFKNGLVRVRFPKREQTQQNVKRIPVTAESGASNPGAAAQGTQPATALPTAGAPQGPCDDRTRAA